MGSAGIRIHLLDLLVDLVIISALSVPASGYTCIEKDKNKDTHHACLISEEVDLFETFSFYVPQCICLIPAVREDVERYLTSNRVC
jgi:hypothetical protein